MRNPQANIRYDHWAMGSWGCPHEVDERCQRVNGAYCVPGMKGCVLHGKVEFPDGPPPTPRWPDGEADRGRGVPDEDA